MSQSYKVFSKILIALSALIGAMAPSWICAAQDVIEDAALCGPGARRIPWEIVTITFNVSSITDPTVTFLGFLQDNKTGRSVATPAPISFVGGSGSLPSLSLEVPSHYNSVTFGVKVISPLDAVSSGEIQALVTTQHGSTLYDMEPLFPRIYRRCGCSDYLAWIYPTRSPIVGSSVVIPFPGNTTINWRKIATPILTIILKLISLYINEKRSIKRWPIDFLNLWFYFLEMVLGRRSEEGVLNNLLQALLDTTDRFCIQCRRI